MAYSLSNLIFEEYKLRKLINLEQPVELVRYGNGLDNDLSKSRMVLGNQILVDERLVM